MFIYSQDQRFLEEAQECSIHRAINGAGCRIDVNGKIFGQYAEKDKGRSIMNEIARAVRSGEQIYIMPADGEQTAQAGDENQKSSIQRLKDEFDIRTVLDDGKIIFIGLLPWTGISAKASGKDDVWPTIQKLMADAEHRLIKE